MKDLDQPAGLPPLAPGELFTDAGGQHHLAEVIVERLLIEFRGDLCGIEFRHRSRDTWAVLLADASESGRWRYQMLDRDGMLGHVSRSSWQEALVAMVENGFYVPEVGILGELEDTARWKRGVEMIDLAQQYNSGTISFDDMLKRRREIDLRWSTAHANHSLWNAGNPAPAVTFESRICGRVLGMHGEAATSDASSKTAIAATEEAEVRTLEPAHATLAYE